MKKILCSLFVLLATISMSSCSFYHKPITPMNTHINYEGDGYYRRSSYTESYENIYTQKPSSIDENIYKDIYYDFHYLPSTGKQKILVIPVEFSDYPASSLKGGERGSLKYIENAFFGKKDSTFFESVASYYNKSSYGHLILEGKVSNWFKLNKTVEEVKKSTSDQIKSKSVLIEAINWYKSTYDDIENFDQNKDGYIDAVYLIYSAPQRYNDDFLWAHTYFNRTKESGIQAFNYSWASYNFMFYTTEKPETHVYIHETGHLLGLKDYYSSDENGYAPTCYFDMMDTNIGDHNAFSKMLLNWTTPYVITDECSITINSFTESGDCIIIPNNHWNGSAMEEYLLLEYYTPTNLHKEDVTNGWQYRNLNSAGIRVYHVDARIGYIRNFGGEIDGYLGIDDPTNLIQQLSTYHLDFANTNTQSTTQSTNNKYHYLLKLLRAKQYDKEGSPADNDLLFKEGDSFYQRVNDPNYSFSFNNGNVPNFWFEITSLSESQVTIKFYKNI